MAKQKDTIVSGNKDKDKGGGETPSALTIQFGRTGKDVAEVRNIEISKIGTQKGHNPRKNFPEDEGKILARDIKAHGLISPIVVRPADKSGRYILVAGERRFRAVQSLQWDTIPAIVRTDLENDADAFAFAMAENGEGRLDLNDSEKAEAFARMRHDQKMSAEEIAKVTGYSSRTVARYLNLADAPADVRKAVNDGKVAFSAGLELAKVEDKLRREIVADLAEGSGLSALEIRRRAKEAAREDVAAVQNGKPAEHKGSNRMKGAERAANLVNPRDRTTLANALTTLTLILFNLGGEGEIATEASIRKDLTDGDPGTIAVISTIYCLLWQRGEFSEDGTCIPPVGALVGGLEADDNARERRIAAFFRHVDRVRALALKSGVVADSGIDAAEADSTEKKSKKVKKKKDKDKKKPKTTANAVDAEDDDNDVAAEDDGVGEEIDG
jgi:ParB family chromosome partitioning protein